MQTVGLAIAFSQSPTTSLVEQLHRTVKASTRLQLTAQPERARQATGGPVFIKTKLSNVHSRSVRLSLTQQEFDYRVTVTDASGVEAPLTEWGKKLKLGEAFPIRQTTSDIEPGRDEQVTVEVSKVYDLSRPGTYTVRVVRNGVWPESEEDTRRVIEQVTSNPVSFTIVP